MRRFNLFRKAGKAVGGVTKDGGRLAVISATATHKKLKGAERIRYFATHESVHIAVQTDPKVYNTLSERITKINPEIFTDERIKEKIEEYAKSGIEIDSESAREEIVAEYIGEALAKSDRKTLHKIIGDKRNVAEVLLDMVNKLIDLFRNDKELRKGYEKAREAIVEAINSIDKERAARHEEGRTESTKTTENVKYALSGINEEGIEIYETSKEIKELPIKEKKRRFLNLMKEEYKGRTAKFIAGGKTYYAIFDKADLQKNVYGDRLSSHKGWEAKINTGADGDIFELVENSTYSGSSKESGKDIDAHKGIIDWDYFVKKVEIDGVLYDLIANVRKNSDSQYVYSIQLNENKRRQTVQQKVNKTFVNQARSASNDDSVSQKSETVNTQYMQKGKKYAVSDDQGAEKITADDVKSVQSVGRKSVNDFSSEDIKKTENFARKYFKEMGAKSPFFRAWFGDWRANDTTKVKVADKKGAVRGVTKNIDTGWDINVSGKIFNETKSHNQSYNVTAQPYLDYINSIVENAVLLDSYAIPEKKAKSPNSVMMHSLYAVADMGNGPEILKLYIEELNDVNADGTMKRAYQLQNIENQQLNDRVQGKTLAPSASTADIDTIADLFAVVKQKDKNFNPKPSSTLINEDGTPKVVYHGTDAEFTAFDRTKGRSSMDIQGMFFSPWEIDARGYGGNVGEYYLSIKNPAPEGIAYKALKMFAGQNYAGIKAREYLEKLGYDGVNNSDEEIIAFYSNQIKSATDNIGTFDKGNNDIRYAVSDEQGTEKITADDVNREKYRNIADYFRIKNINDYIDVQRNVYNTLKREGFFSDDGATSRTVVNKDSGMEIVINKSSIKETFSKGSRFEHLGKERKYYKLATISNIADLIENAKLKIDNEKNNHAQNSSLNFAYLVAETSIDGTPVEVYIDIRKSPQKNKMWMHQVYTKKGTEVVPTGASSKIGLMNLDAKDIIHDDGENVNNNVKYSASDEASDGGDGKKEKYFKPGSNRARDIDIVSKTEDGKKNHRLMRNLAESQFTSEETAKDISEDARSGNYSYSTYSDKAAASAANRWFSSHGNDVLSAANDILSLLKDGKVKNKTDVAKTVLINNILEEKRLLGRKTVLFGHFRPNSTVFKMDSLNGLDTAPQGAQSQKGGTVQRVTDFFSQKIGTSVTCSDVVRMTGVEPARHKAQEPKSCTSANFATSA